MAIICSGSVCVEFTIRIWNSYRHCLEMSLQKNCVCPSFLHPKKLPWWHGESMEGRESSNTASSKVVQAPGHRKRSQSPIHPNHIAITVHLWGLNSNGPFCNCVEEMFLPVSTTRSRSILLPILFSLLCQNPQDGQFKKRKGLFVFTVSKVSVRCYLSYGLAWVIVGWPLGPVKKQRTSWWEEDILEGTKKERKELGTEHLLQEHAP